MSFAYDPLNSSESMVSNFTGNTRSRHMYADPHLDQATLSMPADIKKMIAHCRFLFYNNSLISPIVRKVSEYYMTDVVLALDPSLNRTEAHKRVTLKAWDKILNRRLKIRSFGAGVGMDKMVQGNCFVVVNMVYPRSATCSECKATYSIERLDKVPYSGTRKAFMGRCAECKESAEISITEDKEETPDITLLRLNPLNMHVKWNNLSATAIYEYTIPAADIKAIQAGDVDFIRTTEIDFIKAAVSNNKRVRMKPGRVFHVKETGLSDDTQGWGKPILTCVYRDVWHHAVLRRASEAIFLEHISPMRVMSPQPTASIDPTMHLDLGEWKRNLMGDLYSAKIDNNYISISSVPVNVTNVGGDGRNLLITPEMDYIKLLIINGLGVPREAYEGGTSFCQAPETLVFTSSGLETLGELTPDEEGSGEIDRNIVSHDGVKPVTKTFNVGEKLAAVARTRLGLDVVGAYAHPVLVLNKDLSTEFKTLEELSIGDRVAVRAGANLWPSEPPKTNFSFVHETLRTVDVDIPERLTPELARLLGYLISEGSCVENKRIGFGNTDLDVIQDFKECCKSVFGYSPNFHLNTSIHLGTKPMYQTEIGRKKAIEFLYHLGVGGYAADKAVPHIIRTAPKALVAEFLKAYFEGDGGTVDRENKKPVIVTSKSDRLLQEVQLLLLNMGIVSSRYAATYDDSCSNLQIRSEYVYDYEDQIGFVSEIKRSTLARRTPVRKCATESRKIPYLSDALDEFRARHLKGPGSWSVEKISCDLDKELYSVDDVAEIANRERSTIGIYVRSGALKATKVPGENGRFAAYQIKRDDLKDFLESHGLRKKRHAPRHQFEMSYERMSSADLSFIREREPELADRIEYILKTEFIWDEVTDIDLLDTKIEMRDITVGDSHSYQGNGVISHNSGSQLSLKFLQNRFRYDREMTLDMIEWIIDQIAPALKLDKVMPSFKPLKVQDDAQQMQILMNLMQQFKVSTQTVLENVDLDFEEQADKILSELKRSNEINAAAAKAGAESQAETSLIMARSQVEASFEQQKANEAFMARTEDERLVGVQMRRRDYMRGMDPQTMQQFAMMGQASASDVMEVGQLIGMAPQDIFDLVGSIKAGQAQVMQMFGIDPITLNGLPNAAVIKIMNNVLSVADLQLMLSQLFPPQPVPMDPNADPNAQQSSDPNAQAPQQAPPPSPQQQAQQAGSEQEKRVVQDEAEGVDMRPMPQQLPPRRNQGQV